MKTSHSGLTKLKELSQEQPAGSNNQRSLQQILDFRVQLCFRRQIYYLVSKTEPKQYFGVVLESLNGFPLSIYQDILLLFDQRRE